MLVTTPVGTSRPVVGHLIATRKSTEDLSSSQKRLVEMTEIVAAKKSDPAVGFAKRQCVGGYAQQQETQHDFASDVRLGPQFRCLIHRQFLHLEALTQETERRASQRGLRQRHRGDCDPPSH
jgi:hypothetical protein